ncbi:hypothetical protein PsorP6_016320 [Peronosclerospora sorghi]|uniref:Uncharacterized protein n=1 Tax=Peronosclerospora sorghi TaxID=230839 RepID=A0ACC0VQ04_9STRA|nr:hypothetical protein PsorP6_016320 [Peronosclerospora sorghi]
MATLKRHVFLVVALVISATSYAQSSENAVPYRDLGNSTHAHGKGSVRANEKVVNTLEEERAGEAGEKVVKLFGAVISKPMDTEPMAKALEQLGEKNEEAQRVSDVTKDKQPGHDLLDDAALASAVVEKVSSHPEAADEVGRTVVGVKRKANVLQKGKQKQKQQVVDLQGEQGTSRAAVPPSETVDENEHVGTLWMEKLIGEWGIDPDEVEKIENQFKKWNLKQCDDRRVRNMAIGTVYFRPGVDKSKVKGKETNHKSVKRIKKSVRGISHNFRNHGYMLETQNVKNMALDMYSTETRTPGIVDIVEMAIGKAFYDFIHRNKESIPSTVPVLNS